MKWFEVVEDCGDGSSVTRRFRTEEEANKYADMHEEWCYSGVDEVDTESPYFFYKVYDEDE